MALLPTPTLQQGRSETSGRQEGSQYQVGTTLQDVAFKMDFGSYTAAIQRWEQATRPAPSPTVTRADGKPRLNPAFVEWMMGLPDGWVTRCPRCHPHRRR